MKLARMKVELRNEHYLDSLGAGTTDKVRQAELSYNVAQLCTDIADDCCRHWHPGTQSDESIAGRGIA